LKHRATEISAADIAPPLATDVAAVAHPAVAFAF
jgi:hypothetical protein